jgi:hypothetical protein
MPIPTSLEEIAQRQRALADIMAEERRKDPDGPHGPTAYLGDLIELRRELVESTNCIANDLIKYCRRIITDEPEKAAVGCAARILIDVAERNWNRTREDSLAGAVEALAGSFGVDKVRAVLDAVEDALEAPASPQVPTWR